MRIIKLDAIDSTNSYLRKLSALEIVEDYTVILTKHQTQGRGQMGTVWNSEKSKNLMFSVFKDVSSFSLEYPFFISIVTSLALLRTLHKFSIPKLSIKWPNDILSEDKKVCGVLIETVIKQNQVTNAIIGIGLNVNQTNFDNLPKAASLKLVSGKVFNVEEILQVIIKYLKHYFKVLKLGDYNAIKEEYESFLFRKDKPSTFRDSRGAVFSGYIKSVSLYGNLQVLLEDDVLKEFDLKEISLLY